MDRRSCFQKDRTKKEGLGSLSGFQAAPTRINGSYNPDQIVTAYEFHKTEKQQESNIKP